LAFSHLATMPKRPPRPCAVRGCKHLVHEGSRCQAHQLPRPRDERPSAAARGYGYDWKVKVRDPYLAAHPYCSNPFGLHGPFVLAVVVDHIKPKKQGGTDDWSNLQTLCRACDNKKHYYDGSKRVRA
jgi:5-methylcytosine-specific restriction protein A